MYEAGSWQQPRKSGARLECSCNRSRERPVCARRITLARWLSAAPLRERHKAQLASDRMASDSRHRRVLADACRARRDSEDEPVATCEFATLGERPIKIGARDRAHCAHPRAVADELLEGTLLRTATLGPLLSGPRVAGPTARRARNPKLATALKPASTRGNGCQWANGRGKGKSARKIKKVDLLPIVRIAKAPLTFGELDHLSTEDLRSLIMAADAWFSAISCDHYRVITIVANSVADQS
jgi:hypothetical protein